MFLLIYFLTAFVAVESDLTVDQYNDMINNFIKTTENYEHPSSAQDFIPGTYDTTDCNNGGRYDFIIVGAGSAGTVLANRLSEVSKWNVLLLEAGGEENDLTDIPYMFDYLRLSQFNWGYKSVPQKNSLYGYLNNSEIIPRGKVLGGSSTINALMYIRGNKQDFEKWGKTSPGWSYADILPLFKKSEKAYINNSIENYNYHGHNGLLNVQNAEILTEVTNAFLGAYTELGRKMTDYNGVNQFGGSLLQLNSVKGRRDSGGKAFLNPVRKRKNLMVLTQAYVTELLVKGDTVFGVTYMKNTKTYCSYASKEVILSAGSVNSPQLLMLSGIGPKDDLVKLGINVVKDLPVGRNLWDHVCMALQPFTTNLTLPDQSQKELIQEYLQGRGFYTAPDGIQDVGFQTLYSSDKTVPDIEHILRASKIPTMPYEYYKQTKNFNKDIYDNIFKPLEGNVTWSIYSVLLHPKSRGTIKLQSKNPFDFPLIDPQYFTDPNDLETMLAGIKDTIRISKTNAMQKIDSKIFPIKLPNCQKYPYATDDYYRCLIQSLASTLHHFSGSCSMGKGERSSVVDYRLKVHGIKGIRVVDCSVIPITTSGHTNALAYMIGEKAAELIKKDWLKRQSMGLFQKYLFKMYCMFKRIIKLFG